MSYLIAQWPKPAQVYAVSTTRHVGTSQIPFDNNNLALHVGDNPAHVQLNRDRLNEQLFLPSTPQWLDQTHSTEVVIIEESTNRIADASITRQKNTVLAILTADCLPLLICHKNGREVAAVHAGWKGLLNGIIEKTLDKMPGASSDYMVWIGPAICGQCYSVGIDIKEQFAARYVYCQQAFTRKKHQYYLNLPLMAKLILNNKGIADVYQSSQCTYERTNDFYSYRHHAQTGRIASLIWFN